MLFNRESRSHLTSQEIVVSLRVTVRTVYRLCGDEELPFLRWRHVIRIPRDKFFALVPAARAMVCRVRREWDVYHALASGYGQHLGARQARFSASPAKILPKISQR